MSKRVLVVRGRVGPKMDDPMLEFIAASPADQITSFAGSGMPFANPEQAFDQTPNRGSVEVGVDQAFEVHVIEPNSFLDRVSVKVAPSIFLRYRHNGRVVSEQLVIGKSIAHRDISYPSERTSALFYDTRAIEEARGPRTQETILYDSEYLVDPGPTFWGLRPPV